LGERGILGEEPEAGMDRVRAAAARRSDDRRDVKQIDGIRAIRPWLDDVDTEALRRTPDPAGDLAAIRDEEPSNRPSGWARGRHRKARKQADLADGSIRGHADRV